MPKAPSSQQQVVAEFRRALKDTRASKKVQKALFEAGIVESNLQNLNYGDRDSRGPLQQRPSQGWKHANDPYRAALDFIKQAQAVQHKYGRAGDLAQAVQRSAYPDRYQQHSGEAAALLRGKTAGAPRTPSPAPGNPSSVSGDAKKQIALSLLGFGNVGGDSYGDPLTMALTQALQQKSTPSPTSPQAQPQPAGHVRSGGKTSFDGKPVASWIAPILAKARKTGLWHGGVNSGVRSKSEQLAAAKRYGLQHYPHGPLASNHVEGHPGAVDVSDPEGLKKALRALHNHKLKSAMPEDPVHFSGSGY